MWPRQLQFYLASLNVLLEGKIHKNPSGWKFADIARPRTVWVVVGHQFVACGKNTADRRSEFKVE